MPPHDDDLSTIRRLDLRRGSPVDPDTARFSERVAEGLRITGDLVRWMRTWMRGEAEDVFAR